VRDAPAVAMAKYEPSGETDTSRIHSSNLKLKQALPKRFVFQLVSTVALAAVRLNIATWSRATPPARVEVPDHAHLRVLGVEVDRES
jgi:hypothetical protein